MNPKDEYGKEALRLLEGKVAGDETDARRAARIAEAQVYATLEVARQTWWLADNIITYLKPGSDR